MRGLPRRLAACSAKDVGTQAGAAVSQARRGRCYGGGSEVTMNEADAGRDHATQAIVAGGVPETGKRDGH